MWMSFTGPDIELEATGGVTEFSQIASIGGSIAFAQNNKMPSFLMS
jgi:hypothetical protein